VRECEVTKFHSSVKPRRGKNSLGAFVRPITFTGGERKISGIFKEKLLRNGGRGEGSGAAGTGFLPREMFIFSREVPSFDPV